MEENTEYTELETTTEEYIEESNTESTEESGTQNPEPAEDFNAGAETEDSGNDEFSESNDDSSGTVTDAEDSSVALPGTDTENVPEAAGPDASEDTSLLERVENLLDALAPETDEVIAENDSGGDSEPEISEYDAQTLETLQSINATLSAMRTENEIRYTETLKYRDETKEVQYYISSLLEMNALLLIGTGLFIALLCGGKFADIFFKRMREKE